MEENLSDLKSLQIIAVIELIASSSMTKKAACEAQGVSVSTFDRAVAESPELVKEFVLARKKIIQDRYEDFVSAEDKVIRSILDSINSNEFDKLSVSEKLSILSQLESRRSKTETQLGLIGGPENNQGAAIKMLGVDVLPPIGLRPGTARVTQRETTMEVSFDNGGSDQAASIQIEGQVLPLAPSSESPQPFEEQK